MVQFFCDRVENITGKRRKCWLPAFSLFPVMFLKGFFLMVMKTRDCFVNGLTLYPTMQSVKTLKWKAFENIIGKGEMLYHFVHNILSRILHVTLCKKIIHDHE